jgi:hypothetical protein
VLGTALDVFADPMSRLISCFAAVSLILTSAIAQAQQQDPTALQQLAKQVADKGWIVYSSRTAKGDWDLFLMRPDGSRLRLRPVCW